MLRIGSCFMTCAGAIMGVGALALAPADDVVLSRPDGMHRYRITVSEHSEMVDTRTTLVFDLRRDGKGMDHILLREAVTRDDRADRTIRHELDEVCRAASGGSEDYLADITLTSDSRALDEMIPVCIPEPIFITLTDAISFLVVQSDPGWGIDRLHKAGDEARTRSFVAAWRRPPQVIDATIHCTGGVTRLDRVEDGVAHLRWTADTMALSMIREVKISAQETMRMLMTGTEHFSLELDVDAATGVLLGGRTLRDDVDAKIWMPYEGDRAPEPGHWPEEGGRPLAVTRVLVLESVE